MMIVVDLLIPRGLTWVGYGPNLNILCDGHIGSTIDGSLCTLAELDNWEMRISAELDN